MMDANQSANFSSQYASKPRKKYRSAFLRELFKILENEEFSDLIKWSCDGTHVELIKPDEFAIRALPKMYKHSKLTSFTKQLYMYHFKRTTPPGKSSMAFYHPSFQKGRSDLILTIHRQHVVQRKKLESESQSEERVQEQYFYKQKKPKTLSSQEFAEISFSEHLLPQISEMNLLFSEDHLQPNEQDTTIINSQINTSEKQSDRQIPNVASQQMSKEISLEADFRLLVQIASNSRGNIDGTNLPVGFYEFRNILERMLGFHQIDESPFDFPNLFAHNE